MLRLLELLTSAVLFACGALHLKKDRKMSGILNLITGALMLSSALMPKKGGAVSAVEEGEGSETEIILIEE